jgi:carbon storage regulator
MLVLSRKLGEEIVLPNCDVTIAVVAIAGNRVRLGVTAPTETPVHRRETWNRMNEEHPAKDLRTDSAVAREDRLERQIVERTGGRIRSLRVEALPGRIVVHGRAGSYYVRQLAHAAVLETLGPAGDAGLTEQVEVDIQVAL